LPALPWGPVRMVASPFFAESPCGQGQSNSWPPLPVSLLGLTLAVHC
jgi:hypothetical protein